MSHCRRSELPGLTRVSFVVTTWPPGLHAAKFALAWVPAVKDAGAEAGLWL